MSKGMEDRGQRWGSPLTVSPSCFLRKGLSLHLELTNWATLAGHQVSGTLFALFLESWDYRYTAMPGLLCGYRGPKLGSSFFHSKRFINCTISLATLYTLFITFHSLPTFEYMDLIQNSSEILDCISTSSD